MKSNLITKGQMFKLKIFSLLIISSFLFSNYSFADQTSEDAWFGVFLKKKISQNLSFWGESQMRYDLTSTSMQQTLFRFGLLKKINKSSEAGLLLAFVQSDTNKEHRLALQHVQKYGNLFSLSASHRARLEFRNFENKGAVSPRFRYLLRLESQTIKNLKPVFWNEAFINTEEEPLTGMRYFERNRAFLGLRKKLKNDSAIEFGYINQFTPRSSQDSQEHILFFGMFFN